jgi:2-polyprenyl-3-methyl-5-hydroxy-6-metoxy-1,4-benzoquinol methylase
VRCNLCGADDAKLLYRAPVKPQREGVYNRDLWDVVQCRRCGLIYVNPRIDDEARAFFYSFKTPGDKLAVQARFFDNPELQRPLWLRYLRILQRERAQGKLLDIGCGPGRFLVEARRQGYEVTGQEVAGLFIDYCRKQQGIPIHGDLLENLDLQPGSFDVVTAFDVIEHHPDPRKLLGQMRSLLRDGGLAMISTHDIGNFFARRYGVRWRYLHPIPHITYFTRDTLARMLVESDFRVIRKGGIHTMDATKWAEAQNLITAILKTLLLRSIILFVYRPLTSRLPALTRWRLKLGSVALDHQKLLAQTGDQIIMDDDMVILAEAV